ncbi:MAG: phospho-sugar mutase [Chrysiogenales bacterium]|nr:MAG: phospho-sugar mutase [Chrysiogenales bacterium]
MLTERPAYALRTSASGVIRLDDGERTISDGTVMDTTIEKNITEWTLPPFDRETIEEIRNLIESGATRELEDRFYRALEFGTGGLRGVIGAGTNRMNVYTVGMATQGLANYIGKMKDGEKGVVIARDSRRFSDIFAKETASILAGNGIPVYIFEDIVPVPIASFAIRHLNAMSGVVITASHNPPEYNGYKVYWSDGGQIIPPHDVRIISEVGRVDSIAAIKKIPYEDGLSSGKITIIRDEIVDCYIQRLEESALRPPGKSGVSIAYTPLHGSGYRIIPRVLSHFGFTKISLQEEQSRPDGGFPTIASPNPEDPAAMEMVVNLARRVNADIVLATDPDADRMGVGFRGSDGDYTLINGNQIGTMLEYYLLSRMHESGSLTPDAAVVKTIVTTELQREIADDFGCKMYDVLTGFKWIAAKMQEFDRTGEARFIFGGEESYGYLPVPFVRDKDSVSSCYFFAEMTDWLSSKNMTLSGFLDEIYIAYALYREGLHSMTLRGKEGEEKIAMIMEHFRSNPPAEIAGIPVRSMNDIERRVNKDILTGRETHLSDLPASNVIQFFLSDGSKVTMRPSGTEPKIKFYFSVREAVDRESIEAMKMNIGDKLDAIRNDVLKKVEAAG